MKQSFSLLRNDTGSIVMMTAVLMAVLVGALALVIDLGHLHTVQSELRNAADTCALRGARAFVPDVPLNPGGQPGLSPTDPNPSNAVAQATATIGVNKSDNVALRDLPSSDIQTGIWYYVKNESPDPNVQLQPWTWPPSASEWGKYIGPGIRLETRREGSYNSGPVGMTLANVFGIPTVGVRTMATAALSGVGGFLPGSPTFPYGINVNLLPPNPSGIWEITSRTDSTDEGGWTNLIPGNPPPNTSANDVKRILSGTPISSEVNQGDYISMNNGVACSALKAMINDNGGLWHLVRENTVPGHEGAPNNWYIPDPNYVYPTSGQAGVLTVMLPVTQLTKFNQHTMYGAITVDIIRVKDSPECNFTIQNIHDYVAPGTRGGGPFYGTLSTEPKLVQ